MSPPVELLQRAINRARLSLREKNEAVGGLNKLR
jgi:hypothetical protein